MRKRRVLGGLLVLVAAVGANLQAHAANVCIDAQGRKTLTDKACPPVVPPPPPPPPPPPLACKLTPDQLRRASRLENQFVARFANEAAHVKAEAAELKVVTDRIQIAKGRRDELIEQRKPLEKELEFYKGKPVPDWLKNKLDANDAHLAAVNDILRNREQELADIKAHFQCARDTFGKMWTPGTPAGSSGCDRPPCAGPL